MLLESCVEFNISGARLAPDLQAARGRNLHHLPFQFTARVLPFQEPPPGQHARVDVPQKAPATAPRRSACTMPPCSHCFAPSRGKTCATTPGAAPPPWPPSCWAWRWRLPCMSSTHRRWTSSRRPCAPSTASPTWKCAPCKARWAKTCLPRSPPTPTWPAPTRCWRPRPWPALQSKRPALPPSPCACWGPMPCCCPPWPRPSCPGHGKARRVMPSLPPPPFTSTPLRYSRWACRPRAASPAPRCNCKPACAPWPCKSQAP